MASKELELIEELKEYLKGTKDYFRFKFLLDELKQDVNDLELYKKALELALPKKTRKYILEKARRELENGKY